MTSERDPTGRLPGALQSGTEVRAMFGRIARRYDLMNRLMTGGRDGAWRRLAVRRALDGVVSGARVLDIATGTGDLALALAAGGAREVVGADFAPPMLQAAAAKRVPGALIPSRGSAIAAQPLPPVWVVADALRLPFADAGFDACTVAFGLRNMADYAAALREMGRVLRPGGRFVCLELTPYRRPLLRAVFGWYFSRIVPLVGGRLSGDREAYRYLPSSVAAFPDADTLAVMMRRSGLYEVSYRLLGGGTVAIHIGTKGEVPLAAPVYAGGSPHVSESTPSRTSRTQSPE